MKTWEWVILGCCFGFCFAHFGNEATRRLMYKAMKMAEEMNWSMAQFNAFWFRKR